MSRDYKRNWGIGESMGVWECGSMGVGEYGSGGVWGMGHGAWGKRVWEYESVGVWECGAGEFAIS